MTVASIFSPAVEFLLRDVSQRVAITPRREVEDFLSFVKNRGKVETHVHLEASVPASFYTGCYTSACWDGLAPWQRAPFADFRSFVMAWVDLTKCIRKLSDIEELSKAFVEGRVAENIKYTEAYFSPADFSLLRKRFKVLPEIFEFYDVMRAYVRGLKEGLKKNPGVEVRLILDSFWPSTQNEKHTIVEGLRLAKSDEEFFDEAGIPYIVAVGFGGAEQPEDIELTLDFVNQVRSLGYKIDIHSGEGGDPNQHMHHVDKLRPDRVSHGFSGIPQGWYFRDNLVMCPISNLLLKTFSGPSEMHPAFELLRHGEPISIGTDDPLLLGHSLSEEFAFLFAVDRQISERVFEKIQLDTRTRVLCPIACNRVFNA